MTEPANGNLESVVLAGGCFWCTEAVFQRLRGVVKVAPGYAGGKSANPTYEKIQNDNTGEAEVVNVEFDPNVISLKQILEVFWQTHDPTTPNQQGADIGPQYRSVVFYHDQKQKEIAESTKTAMQSIWDDKIITEILPFSNFHAAEEYHFDYYNQNSKAPYCQIVINPKLAKLKEKFAELLN